jgi:hypothetical protein
MLNDVGLALRLNIEICTIPSPLALKAGEHKRVSFRGEGTGVRGKVIAVFLDFLVCHQA